MQPSGDEHGYWGKDANGDEKHQEPVAPQAVVQRDDSTGPDDSSAKNDDPQLPFGNGSDAEEPDGGFVLSEDENVSWEALEFIDHAKPAGWFLAFGVFVVALLYLSIFILHDWFMAVGSVVMCVAIGVVGIRKPRMLHYALDGSGLHIDGKVLQYSQFHSFGVVKDDGLWSLLLRPNARFRPMLSIYFEEQQGEKIVDVLSHFLPMENYNFDAVDRMSRKLHF